MTRAAFRPLVAVLLATAVLAGCSGSGAGGQAAATIRIGEFASLTGKEATFGTSSHEGTVLAIEELNAAGGLLGKQLELVYEDNRSTPGESLTIAKKLINNDKVVAILGEVASGRSLEVAPFAQQSRIRRSRPRPPTPTSRRSATTSSASASSIRSRANCCPISPRAR
jgi:branched-chain amino acid transport system substrate-binding protein